MSGSWFVVRCWLRMTSKSTKIRGWRTKFQTHVSASYMRIEKRTKYINTYLHLNQKLYLWRNIVTDPEKFVQFLTKPISKRWTIILMVCNYFSQKLKRSQTSILDSTRWPSISMNSKKHSRWMDSSKQSSRLSKSTLISKRYMKESCRGDIQKNRTISEFSSLKYSDPSSFVCPTTHTCLEPRTTHMFDRIFDSHYWLSTVSDVDNDVRNC